MDAYSSYIIQTSNARLDELRREAAEYALSRTARAGRLSSWARVRNGLRRRRPVSVEPVTTMALPVPEAGDEPLRRTA